MKFKEIEGHPNYLVYEDGKIWSKKYRINIKPRLAKNGYLRISLNGKAYPLHRLIAKAFILNPYNKPFINHKNGKKDDNRIDNLEWCTASENMIHAVKNRLMPIGEHNYLARKIVQYDLNGSFIRIWNCMTDASKEFNIEVSALTRCCTLNDNNHRAGNFMWRYIEDFKENINPFYKPTSNHMYKIYQYDIDGLFIKEWESSSLASKELNISNSLISRTAKNTKGLAGQYQWRLFKCDKINKYESPYLEKSIIQYNLNGVILNKYKSLREAERESGINRKSIYKFCEGLLKKNNLNNYIFKYT